MNNFLRKWCKPTEEPRSCEECGELCEFAYTDGLCCECFNEFSYEKHSLCKICKKRQEDKQKLWEWLHDNTIPLTHFIPFWRMIKSVYIRNYRKSVLKIIEKSIGGN